MRGALEQSLSLFNVATETGFLDRKVSHHLLGQFRVYDLCRLALWCISEVGPRSTKQLDMVNVVTRQTTHIASIVLTPLPVEVGAIHRVALQARLVRFG